MKIVVYADVHEFSKYKEVSDILPVSREVVIGEDSYAVGDIFDLKGCEPNNLSQALNQFEQFKVIFKDRYVLGNHEQDRCLTPRYFTKVINKKNVLFTHGDYILMGEAKAIAFRNDKMGKGSGFIQWLGSLKNGSISNKESKLLAAYAKENGSEILICGHAHPKKVYDKIVDGIRVICCPQGRTEINI